MSHRPYPNAGRTLWQLARVAAKSLRRLVPPGASDKIFTNPQAQAIWEQDLPVEERMRRIRALMDAEHQGG